MTKKLLMVMATKPSFKYCSRCGGRKALTCFSNAPLNSDGKQSLCKSCAKESTRFWRLKNPAKNADVSKQWRLKHPDKVRLNNFRLRRSRQIATYGRIVEIHEMIYDRYRAARALGFRSGLEVRIARELDALKVKYEYECHTIRFQQPAEDRSYTPDLVLDSGVVIELKGVWDSADRKKLRLVKAQHPLLDLRIVFSNANARISKQSKTTYGMVCKKLGIPYASKSVPVEWTQEKTNVESLQALKKASEVIGTETSRI